jgi:metal-responsive CopG/Arc/MetJ family transcriptional regulator
MSKRQKGRRRKGGRPKLGKRKLRAVSTRLPAELVVKIERWAERVGISRSRAIRDLIVRGLRNA